MYKDINIECLLLTTTYMYALKSHHFCIKGLHTVSGQRTATTTATGKIHEYSKVQMEGIHYLLTL